MPHLVLEPLAALPLRCPLVRRIQVSMLGCSKTSLWDCAPAAAAGSSARVPSGGLVVLEPLPSVAASAGDVADCERCSSAAKMIPQRSPTRTIFAMVQAFASHLNA